MLELKATETLDSAPTDHGTETDPRTLTSATEPLLTDPLRTTLATTDMLSPLLTPTHTVPSPLRPTVMPLSRTVPVATNSEEPPLPTAPTDGAVPAVTGDRPLLVSRDPAPMP